MDYGYGPVSGLARDLLNKKSSAGDTSVMAQQAQASNDKSGDEVRNAELAYWLDLQKKKDDIGLKNNDNPYAYSDLTVKFGNPSY